MRIVPLHQKCLKVKKNFAKGIVLLTVYMAQWIGHKGSEATCRRFKQRYKFFTTIPETIKIYLVPKMIVSILLLKSEEPTGSGFEYEQEVCF